MLLIPEFVLYAFRMLPAVLLRLAIGALLLCVAACASRVRAPVEERLPPIPPPIVAPDPPPLPVVVPDWRPQTYTVKRGDMLYAIALDHGLDYREFAAWNTIENLNLIRPGQVLRLAAPGDNAGVQTTPLKILPPLVAGDPIPAPSVVAQPSPAAGARNTESYKTQPKAVKEPYSEQAIRDLQRIPGSAPGTTSALPPEAPPPLVARVDPKLAPDGQDRDDSVDWVWPAKGKIVTGFSEVASLKGIDISGTAGQSVAASASGKVVYAGSGLRGYGKLIIIKHNGTFLSAYAHNRDILVKEGQQVSKGQKIAEMGSTDADQVKLHFEIRRQGKPMDPLKYLPPT